MGSNSVFDWLGGEKLELICCKKKPLSKAERSYEWGVELLL